MKLNNLTLGERSTHGRICGSRSLSSTTQFSSILGVVLSIQIYIWAEWLHLWKGLRLEKSGHSDLNASRILASTITTIITITTITMIAIITITKWGHTWKEQDGLICMLEMLSKDTDWLILKYMLTYEIIVVCCRSQSQEEPLLNCWCWLLRVRCTWTKLGYSSASSSSSSSSYTWTKLGMLIVFLIASRLLQLASFSFTATWSSRSGWLDLVDRR